MSRPLCEVAIPAVPGDDGVIQWYGENWGAPVCKPEQHRETPIGRPCAGCDVFIFAGDRGLLLAFGGTGSPMRLPFHLSCLLSSLGIDR